ncbi:MAG: histidinol-phosphatase HisJ family protein [Verrucomicrobia bacterium]|nr:histidinol-phosphatase HisJ family protein [Verrucomicrobiota bacterium]
MRCDSDYHTHPQGHAIRPYTVELLQPWVNRCRERRIESIAFTDHDRYHEGIDFDIIDRLREVNPDLEILIGIELDNDPVTSKAGLNWVEANWDRLDFVLGSVHYFPSAEKMFDGADQAQQLLDKGIELAFEEYREQLGIVIGRGNIDCLSHLDLVKIHALIPDSYDPAAFFTPVLDRIRSAGLALEINTAGWRKKIGEQYPSEPILQAALNLGIPITISSDAHSYVQVGEDYDKLGLLADRLGLQKPTRYWRHQRRR